MKQVDIDTALNQVINDFTGKRIAMPNGQYQGECTAPITWYLQYLGLPWNLPMHNVRADGWGVVHPPQLTPFFNFEDFQPGKAYPRGSILMWDSPHIAIVHSDAGGDNAVTCFEQNADPDGSPCGLHIRQLNTASHHATYAMVPIVEVGPPMVTLGQLSQLYQTLLNRQPDQAGIDHYVGHYTEAFVEEDIKKSAEYVQLHSVKPPKPPAAPVPINYGQTVTIDYTYRGYNSATGAGNYTEKDLKQHVPAGTYTQIKTYTNRPDLVNIQNGDRSIYCWINLGEKEIIEREQAAQIAAKLAADEAKAKEEAEAQAAASAAQAAKDAELAASWNHPKPEPVAEPEPTPVLVPADSISTAKSTYTPLSSDRKPVDYLVTEVGGLTISDIYNGSPDIHIPEDTKLAMYGWWVDNGITYLRPKLKDDELFQKWYGVRTSNVETGVPYLENASIYRTDDLTDEDKISVINSHKHGTGAKEFDFKQDLYLIKIALAHLVKNLNVRAFDIFPAKLVKDTKDELKKQRKI
jgi:hypothetical protein